MMTRRLRAVLLLLLLSACGGMQARLDKNIDDTGGQDPEVDGLGEFDDTVVLQPPFNLGHQRAIVYALRKMLPRIAEEDAVVTMDADGEDRPEDLPRLLAALGEGEAAASQPLAVSALTGEGIERLLGANRRVEHLRSKWPPACLKRASPRFNEARKCSS